MNKYQTGKIYKLIDNINGNEYYGSTIQDLKKRKWGHKSSYERYLNKKHTYVTSFEIIKNNNYQIYLVEDFPCNSKKELETREAYYIRNNKCINKYIPCRTQKEYKIQYHIDNKERENLRRKEHHHKNKERENLRRKNYSLFIKSWGGDPRCNNNLLKINLNIFN